MEIKTKINAVNVIVTDSGVKMQLFMQDKFDAIVVDESNEYVKGKANYVSIGMSILRTALTLHSKAFAKQMAIRSLRSAMRTADAIRSAEDIEKIAEVEKKNRAASSKVDQTIFQVLLAGADITLDRTFVAAGTEVDGYTSDHDRYDTKIAKIVIDDDIVNAVFAVANEG